MNIRIHRLGVLLHLLVCLIVIVLAKFLSSDPMVTMYAIGLCILMNTFLILWNTSPKDAE